MSVTFGPPVKPSMKKASTHFYRITETCEYVIAARSRPDAERKFLKLGSVARDALFEQCTERTIERDTSAFTLTTDHR